MSIAFLLLLYVNNISVAVKCRWNSIRHLDITMWSLTPI